MAEIREVLRLEDQFSRVFSQYINMAEQAATATQEQGAQAASAGAQTAQAYQEATQQAQYMAAKAAEAAEEVKAASAAQKAQADQAASAYRIAAEQAKAAAAQQKAQAQQAASAFTVAQERAKAFTTQVNAASAAQKAQAQQLILSYQVAAERARAMASETNAAAAAQRKQAQEAAYAASSTEKMGRSFSSATSHANGLVSALRTLISIAAIKSTFSLADDIANTTARLSMIARPGESVDDIQAQIMSSANRSRAGYLETASSIGKMGVMAGDTFSGSSEMIQFMEAINKQFVIAGTSAEGVDAAMLQLTQAMSSGVLRGEELNSIFEQAPNIIQTIADYMGVPVGQIRDMASEGQITADIVKNAMLSAADDIDAEFEKMPRTWNQVWTRIQNDAIAAFQPVLDKISEIANSDELTDMMNGLSTAFNAAAAAAEWLIDSILWVKNTLEPYSDEVEIVVGALVGFKVALGLAAAAQWALNAAQEASPTTWVIVAIFAIIAALLLLWENCEEFRGFVADMMTSNAEAMLWLYNEAILPLYNGWLQGQKNMIPGIADFCTTVINLYYDMVTGIVNNVSKAVGALSGLAGAYNALAGAMGQPLIDVDAIQGNLADTSAWLESQRSSALAAINVQRNAIESAQPWEKIDMDAARKALGDINEGIRNFSFVDTFNSLWEQFQDKLPGEDDGEGSSGSTDITNDLLDEIAGNTSSLKKEVSLASEDIKMLVDMAQRDYINQINVQTAAPTITVNASSADGKGMNEQKLANAIGRILLQQSSASTVKAYSIVV